MPEPGDGALTGALAALAAEQPRLQLAPREGSTQTAVLPVRRADLAWALLLAADDAERRLVVQGLAPVDTPPGRLEAAERFVLDANVDLVAATFDTAADGSVRCRCALDLGGVPGELLSPELCLALLRDLVLRCTALCAASWPDLVRLLRAPAPSPAG